nr:IS3 family transposase [Micromonospora fiedleri]
MSVAGFIASQRTEHSVPHAIACRALGVSESWFYKWRDRPPTPRDDRRARLAAAVQKVFDDSGGTYGSPRIGIELRESGWQVSDNTIAQLMAELGLAARVTRRRRGLTRQGKRPAAPDLVKRVFTAPAPDVAWCGDMTEIRTDEGKLYLATVIDLYSRRILGYSMGAHHDAGLVVAALNMAAVTRGGNVEGVIFHSDRGSEGGLNWSSQHLVVMEVFDGTSSAAGGSGSAAGDAFAGPADAGAACGARVLAADRAGQAHRSRGARAGRVDARGGAVVSARWRDAAVESGRADRPLPVVF